MRKEQIKNMATCFLICFLIAGSCIYYLMYRQQEQKIQETQKYEGFQVLLEGTEISALLDDGTVLWVGTKEGIYLLDRETGRQIKRIGADLEMIYASGLVRTDDQTVWAGHNRGLTGFLPDGSRVEFQTPEIPGGRVNTLWAEGDRLWGGTMQGAFVLQKKMGRWYAEEILTEDSGLACNPVNAICKTGNTLWYGAYLNHTPGGISILTEGQGWQYLSTEEGLAHPYINAFWPLSDDQMLVATGQLSAGGLCVLEKRNDTWSVSDTFYKEDGIPGEKIRWLYRDQAGYLWITTESDGLLLCPDVQAVFRHPLTGIVLTEQNGLSDNEVKCITETESAYWLGGKYGLTRISKQSAESIVAEFENEKQSK